MVATRERGESLEMPQTPCPLVQPFPSWVPKPTRRPAVATVARPVVDVEAKACGQTTRTTSPASKSPARNQPRKLASAGLGRKRPPKIPEIPATRPWAQSTSDTDVPMRAPPMSGGRRSNDWRFTKGAVAVGVPASDPPSRCSMKRYETFLVSGQRTLHPLISSSRTRSSAGAWVETWLRSVSTGTSAWRRTFSATEPSSQCERPVRPCVPMTMTSAR